VRKHGLTIDNLLVGRRGTNPIRDGDPLPAEEMNVPANRPGEWT
jgi:hypothetical protein